MNSLLKKLRTDFPDIIFKEGDVFSWSPNKKTIFYENRGDYRYLIHELSHAVLAHKDYSADVELMSMEADAWEKTQELAELYGVEIDDEFVQSNLDTYRDWLYKRSICPECNSNGIQIKKDTYSCVVCNSEWTVNESRIKNLRRYKTKETQ